jgi:DNA-binding transcriptional MerR regulator
MRRTVDYFKKSKFEAKPIIKKLADLGFRLDSCRKVIATWDATAGAKAAADEANIELWYFPDIMRAIAGAIEKSPSYFADDTLRTIGLYGRALADR